MKPLRSPKSGDVTIVMGVILCYIPTFWVLPEKNIEKTLPQKICQTCFPGSSMPFPSFPGFQLFDPHGITWADAIALATAIFADHQQTWIRGHCGVGGVVVVVVVLLRGSTGQ